ncbi:MAG: (Fe-S)-binding protein, partial [Desulfovibrionales bacterium]|nr:(Fe-S)-binding protein [Desulfovibrionales bacterium]
ISPHCCGESGLGALSSPKIYNRLRIRKQNQLRADLRGYAADAPIIVGCPSCKIGIMRSMLEMNEQRSVLHTLEFLAALRHGPNWRKEFVRTVEQSNVRNAVRQIPA